MKAVPGEDAPRAAITPHIFDECECLRRAAADLESGEVLSRDDLAAMAAELRRIATALEALADPDWLRRVDDGQVFYSALMREWARARRSGSPLAMVMIGADGPPAAGDGREVDAQELVLVQALRRCLCRPADRLARYGPGRYAALLPEIDRAGAVSVAEHMRDAVREAQEAQREDHPGTVPVTISIGVGTAPWPDHFGAQSLMGATDEALALVVELGGDQVVEGA